MSNRKIGWGFTGERPVAVQSPSLMPPLADVQTRLDFSSAKSPSITPKRLITLATKTTPSSPALLRGRGGTTTSRLADYHMSKQNPALLDPVLPSSLALQTTPTQRGNSILASPMYNTIRTGSSPKGSFQNHMSRTPTPVSLLRQTLKANKSLSSQSSLVQLATQRGSPRPTGLTASISPVVVRLSRGGTDTPPNVRLNNRGNPSTTRPTNQETAKDPCDKETVLTALRNKRKRWTSLASGVDSSVSMATVTDQPSAKRSKHYAHYSPPSSYGLKRPYESPSTDEQTQQGDSKRSKIVKPVAKKTNNKFSMPDIEYECESEHAQYGVAVITNSGAPPSDNTALSVTKNNSTPPTILLNKEIAKKREDSLSLLRTVFPSTERGSSRRREVPVLCATGLKPHMPAPLTSGVTPTREDLLMDREATAERLQEFLKASEDPPPTSTTTAGIEFTSSGTTTLVSQTDVTGAVESGKGVLKLSTVATAKSVSFANPVSSGLLPTTTTTTTVYTTGATTTALTGVKVTATASLSGPPPVATTAPPTLSLPTTMVPPLKLGGELTSLKQALSTTPLTGALKLGTVAPPLTGALKLGTVATPLTGALKLGTVATPLTGALKLGTVATPLTGALKLGTVATPLTGALKLGTVTTPLTGASLTGVVQQPSTASSGIGIKFSNTGIDLNTAANTGTGIKLNTTPNTGMGPVPKTGLNLAPSLGFTMTPQAPSPLQVSLKPTLATDHSLALTQSKPTLLFGGQQTTGGGLSLSNTGPSLSNAGMSLGNPGLDSQKPGGVSFGASNLSTTGSMFGGATASTQQSNTGFSFGNNPAMSTFAVAQQPSNTGFSLGNNTATTTMTGIQQPSNTGFSLGNNTATTTMTGIQQPSSSGFSFGNSVALTTTTTSSAFSFTASLSTVGNSIFSTQAPKELAKFSAPLLTGSAAPPNSTFSFTGNGGSQQASVFSGSPQQPLALNFGSQTNTLSNSGTGVAANNSMFVGQNDTQASQANKNSFSFSVKSNAPNTAGTPQFNFGQSSSQQTVNFGTVSSQNSNGNAFSFKSGSGMNSSQQNKQTGFSFNAPANNAQSSGSSFNFQQNHPQNSFNSPQPSTPQQAFNFSVNPLNFPAAGTPANRFTPGDSTPRPNARGNRRKGRNKPK